MVRSHGVGGTTKSVIDKVNKDTVDILKDKALQERLAKQGGITVVTDSPAEFDMIIKTDTERYTKMFQAAGIGAK